MTRRDVLKLGTIGAGSLILSSLGLIQPRNAEAYPYDIHTVTDRDFLKSGRIEIINNLCSDIPDEVTFEGNQYARQVNNVELSGGCFGTAIGVPSGYDPAGLKAQARYNTIGVDIISGRNVGCLVDVSNLVLGTPEAIARWNRRDSIPVRGVGFYNFANYRATLFLLGCESGDFTETFFYSDNPSEIVSVAGILTLTSLDSYLENGLQHDEGCVLPDEIKKVYITSDSFVAVDKTLSGRNTYQHACVGNAPALDAYGDEYDLNSFTKHGISWECPTDYVSYKFVTPTFPSAGFNITFQPIANSTPENPVKEFTITR